MITLVALFAACSGGGETAPEIQAPPAELREAEGSLRRAEFDAAKASYEAALAAEPGNPEAASGLAYLAYLSGDYAVSDSHLAKVEATAGDQLGAVKVRRAMVALAAGDLEGMIEHGQASGTPQGALLAAEALMADAEPEAAEPLLQTAAGDPGEVGQTAKEYLSRIQHDDPSVAGLAECSALWAVGERLAAVGAAEELVKGLPDDGGDKDAELLLWAGRAAALGQAQVASNLLEAIGFPPAGQKWRVDATRAIITCSEGDAKQCLAGFDALAGAPPLGLVHARATAATLIGQTDKAAATSLLGETPSDASARAALALGDVELALKLAPDGLLRDSLASP